MPNNWKTNRWLLCCSRDLICGWSTLIVSVIMEKVDTTITTPPQIQWSTSDTSYLLSFSIALINQKRPIHLGEIKSSGTCLEKVITKVNWLINSLIDTNIKSNRNALTTSALFLGAFEMKVMLTLGSVLFHISIWEGLLGTQDTWWKCSSLFLF